MSKGDFTFDAKVAAAEALGMLHEAALGEIDITEDQIGPASELVGIGLMIDRMPTYVEQGPLAFSGGDEQAPEPTFSFTIGDVPAPFPWTAAEPKPAPKVEVVSEDMPDLGRGHSPSYSVVVDFVEVGRICPDCSKDAGDFSDRLQEVVSAAIERATA